MEKFRLDWRRNKKQKEKQISLVGMFPFLGDVVQSSVGKLIPRRGREKKNWEEKNEKRKREREREVRTAGEWHKGARCGCRRFYLSPRAMHRACTTVRDSPSVSFSFLRESLDLLRYADIVHTNVKFSRGTCEPIGFLRRPQHLFSPDDLDRLKILLILERGKEEKKFSTLFEE